MKIRKIILLSLLIVAIGIAITGYLFNRQPEVNSTSINGEIYNDEQEDVTGPGSETLSYGLYETDGQILDTLDIGKKTGKKYKKVLSFSHYLSVKRNYSLIILSDFKTIPFKADNGQFTKSYSFKMNENTVKKIKLEFEMPPNNNEISFVIIPEPNFQLNTENLDVASGLQENFTLRYITKNHKNVDKNYFKPQQTTHELSGEEVFLTSQKTGNKILFKSKNNQKAYLQVFNPQEMPIDYALVALSGTLQRKINGESVKFISVKEHTTNIYEINIPQVRDKQNYQIVLFPTPYKTSTIYEGLNNRSYSTFRTLIEP
ncbi:hypothetical protein [Bacillus atrophaeus]|uniref:hypothetical protein n=1 Tax=Bacillus atrophaeus TaxID=1452 RepID=UPI002E1FC629|nr:hypothetical protein [Bacillus atrophaeus]